MRILITYEDNDDDYHLSISQMYYLGMVIHDIIWEW
jgi:hypothetical protein